MLDTAANFIEELKRINWKYREPQQLDNGKVAVSCGINGKSSHYDMHFFFDEDNHSVCIRVFQLLRVPIDKKFQVMELINQLNSNYRWVKFYTNADDDVNVQTDAIINAENSGKITVELMARTYRVIDEIYPKFMHAIWSEA